MEIIELEVITTGKNGLLLGFKSRIEIAQDRIIDLEDRTINSPNMNNRK